MTTRTLQDTCRGGLMGAWGGAGPAKHFLTLLSLQCGGYLDPVTWSPLTQEQLPPSPAMKQVTDGLTS